MSKLSSGKQGDWEASLTLCPVIQQFLPMLALQELRPGLERAVALHLAKCESCTDELAQYEAVTRLLQASWKDNGHQASQSSPNDLSIITNQEGQSHESSPAQDGSVLEMVPGNTAPPSLRPNRVDAETGARAFARSHNEDFRHAFAEALAGRKYTSSFPQADDAPEHAAASPHPSGKGKKPQRQAVNDAPADAFTTAVRRSLVAIAQLWHDPENQSRSEDHDIC
jgi:hypothetical protein